MTDHSSLITAFPLAATQNSSNAALVSFAIYLGLVFVIAAMANRVRSGKKFVTEYFVGSKNIGLWAFALTYAATAASGGSFMGFPALIYSHGWSLSWWIAGYMVVPLVALGLFAKRINQVGRLAGAITVPELMRRRFSSGSVGNVATILVVFFMFFYLLAQFKAGAQIMATLFEGIPIYQQAVTAVEGATKGIWWIGQADGDYLLCLIVFAVSVIIYTAYGGFRAVVWTDVMQGLVMGVGVIVMLVLALSQVGGLKNATEQLAEMTPPEFGLATIVAEEAADAEIPLIRGDWFATADGGMIRIKNAGTIAAGQSRTAEPVEILKITTPAEIEKIRSSARPGFTAEITETTPYVYGAGKEGVYVTAPGPSKDERHPLETPPFLDLEAQGFLPVFLALSFFAFWNFSGAGQPSYMVRQMAFKNTVVLRRSIVLITLYFSLIYLPLVIIFTCGRVLMPGLEIYPDRAMPEIANFITTAVGHPWLAGLLVAAPFAAVMSSVDSFLLLVSSGVVRDIYQENINPNASEERLKKLSHWVTIIVGALAVFAVLNPPEYLQKLIVFASGGLGASFLMPIVLALYWPRMTAAGTVWGMISGAFTILALYLTGYCVKGKFDEFNLYGIHPFIWSVLVTAIVIVGVSLAGKKPEEKLVEKYFGK